MTKDPRQISASVTLSSHQGMNKSLRFLSGIIVLLIVVLFWVRSGSPPLGSPVAADSSHRNEPQHHTHRSDDIEPRISAARSSSHRKETGENTGSNAAISGMDAFTHDELVHEHVIHTLVPRGSSVVVAGERDQNGKRLFTILTPEPGNPDASSGQIRLSSRTYALDDQQIDQAGMQTLLGNEKRLHNQGEIWSPEDINKTQNQWPTGAALSMPTLMLENGAEGMIEIGSLAEAPHLHRTKIQVSSSPDGYELKTTLQTYRKR
jgi:hypothetical protein